MNTNLIKFLLILKNASLSKKETLIVEYSTIREQMVRLLYCEGLIQSFTLQANTVSKHDFIKIIFRYSSDKSHLRHLKLLSKPSHIKYIKFSDLCNISDKKKIVFLSTDYGFLTSSQCKKLKIGGKLLFLC